LNTVRPCRKGGFPSAAPSSTIDSSRSTPDRTARMISPASLSAASTWSTTTTSAVASSSCGSSRIAGRYEPIAFTCTRSGNASMANSGTVEAVAQHTTSAPDTASSAVVATSTTVSGSSSFRLASNASAFLALRLNTTSFFNGRTACTARTWSAACAPAPSNASCEASSSASRSVATPTTAPVRRVVSGTASVTNCPSGCE
jgi:hypothetical protein